MDTFCEYVFFEEKNMEALKGLFEQREKQWAEQVIVLNGIEAIWHEITKKELYSSCAEWLDEFMRGDHKFIDVSLLDNDKFEKVAEDSEICIYTGCDKDIKEEKIKIKNNYVYSVKEETLEGSIESYRQRFLMSGKIKYIRFLLSSKELLADILMNIYYSIHYYRQKDKTCDLYDSDVDFPFQWKGFYKNRRVGNEKPDKVKKVKGIKEEKTDEVGNEKSDKVKKEKKVNVEKDFVETTGKKIPITCYIKSRDNQGPLIQDVVPNIFRMFVKNADFVNKYSFGNEKKYKNVEAAYTKYNYSIEEQYILEEILGVRLSKSIYDTFKKIFSQLSTNIVMKGGEKGGLELLVEGLLCWRGQNSRILFLQSFQRILPEDAQNSQLIYEGAEEKAIFVEEMLDKCIRWTRNLVKTGDIFYKVLYREMLYVLWRQAKGKLETVEKRCEEYLRKKSFLPSDTIQEFGKNNRDSDEKENVEYQRMYWWIQKYVLNEIANRAEIERKKKLIAKLEKVKDE